MSEQPFNFDKALKGLQSGKDLTGKDGVLMPLIKQLTEAAITAESTIIYLIASIQTERTVRVLKPLKQVLVASNSMPQEIGQVRLNLS